MINYIRAMLSKSPDASTSRFVMLCVSLTFTALDVVWILWNLWHKLPCSEALTLAQTLIAATVTAYGAGKALDKGTT